MNEEYSSAIRQDGLFGAVFEVDAATAHFYLLDMTAAEGQQIIDAFQVPNRLNGEAEGEVRWSKDGGLVAVFRGNRIVAVFDLQQARKDTRRLGRAPRVDDATRF